jgi:hypothetical protein
MPSCSRGVLSVCLGATFVSFALSTVTLGQEVWSGLTLTFTKEAFSDYALPENQDMITPNVVLTRGPAGGLINAAWESGFAIGTSPEFTEWATDLTSEEGQEISAENWANLTFDNWLDAFGGAGSGGSQITDRDAVLHLTAEDIYIDIRFSVWETYRDGSFSYMRAAPPVTLPTGDYNSDFKVDAADYTVWRDTLGSTTDLRANGDNTGTSEDVIDLADYAFWKARFGNDVPMGAASVVPEPASALLLLGGFSIIAFLRKRFSPRGPGQGC